MYSQTYGEVSKDEVINIIYNYIKEDSSCEYNVIIGSDSQNHGDKTKTISVISVYKISKGGIFFWEEKLSKTIDNIVNKIYFETQRSLELTEELIPKLNDLGIKFNFGIHVDIGNNGPTKALIPEIVGWIKSIGYNVEIKPDSFVSSTIADRISK